METKVCCVTGHRSIPAERIDYVKQALRREVLAAIEDGYTRFISGFAEGTDLMFAAIVAEEMEHRPELFLEAAIPYAGRVKTKNQQFHGLLRACSGVKIVCEEYVPSCFMQRNRYMAGESQRIIAVYDGRDGGGTLFTMRYAHVLGKEVRVIRVETSGHFVPKAYQRRQPRDHFFQDLRHTFATMALREGGIKGALYMKSQGASARDAL